MKHKTTQILMETWSNTLNSLSPINLFIGLIELQNPLTQTELILRTDSKDATVLLT